MFQNNSTHAPQLQSNEHDDRIVVALSGDWLVTSLHLVEKQLNTVLTNSPKASVELHSEAIGHMDTAGALLIEKSIRTASAYGKKISFQPYGSTQQELFKTVKLPPIEPKTKEPSANFFIMLCNQCGYEVIEQIRGFGQLIGLIGQYFTSLALALLLKRKARWTSLVYHMEQVGLRAVPIVALLTFLIGTVVAYMGSRQLSDFGAQIFAVNLLEITVLREMAVLITAIVVAGRSSSSFTAQIGSMVSNEEVAALSAMGIDPMEVLVTPRVTALLICLPLLVFIANVMALAGGGLALWYSIDLHPMVFVIRLREVASINNFFVGMVKTPFFALIIGLVGCLQGFRAKGDSASVGFLTTVAVVQAIFLVIVINALFAMFFTAIGI